VRRHRPGRRGHQGITDADRHWFEAHPDQHCRVRLTEPPQLADPLITLGAPVD
jgi:hypothetical protein